MPLNYRTGRLTPVLILIMALLVFGCAPPQVSDIRIQPDTLIPVDGQATLSVQTSGTYPRFRWKAIKGKIVGKGSSVIYIAPDTTGPDTVSVTVTNISGIGGTVTRNVTIQVITSTQLVHKDIPTPTIPLTDTPLPSTSMPPITPTPTNPPIFTDTPTLAPPTNTPTPVPPTPTPTPVPPTPTATPEPPTPTSILTGYPAPVLTAPDNGSGVQGEFPPLFWTWDGKLGENEFFEVRIWHESITDYHPALGWVKVPQFDYNISGEYAGKYYWTVTVVQGANARPKDWTLQSWWPYPMWEGELVAELSPESEPRFFMFTPDDGAGSGPSPISKPPPPCKEPPCD